jgi:hypothetical protein
MFNFFHCIAVFTINTFILGRGKEAFNTLIVIGAATLAHAAQNPVPGQHFRKDRTAVLSATIAMEDQIFLLIASCFI